MEPINELATALAKAQAEFPDIPKDCTATLRGETKEGKPYDYSYQYADLATIIKATRPSLIKHGLSTAQLVTTSPDGKVGCVQTLLMHASGQQVETKYYFLISVKMQQTGASITYIRRYCLQGILGVSSEQDTDGPTENAPKPRQQLPQRGPNTNPQQRGNNSIPPRQMNPVRPPVQGQQPVSGGNRNAPQANAQQQAPHPTYSEDEDSEFGRYTGEKAPLATTPAPAEYRGPIQQGTGLITIQDYDDLINSALNNGWSKSDLTGLMLSKYKTIIYGKLPLKCMQEMIDHMSKNLPVRPDARNPEHWQEPNA